MSIINDFLSAAEKEFEFPVLFEEAVSTPEAIFPHRVTLEYEKDDFGPIVVEELDNTLAIFQYKYKADSEGNGRWRTIGIQTANSAEKAIEIIKKRCFSNQT